MMRMQPWAVLLVMGIIMFGVGCSAKSTVGLAAGELPEVDRLSPEQSLPPAPIPEESKPKESESLASQLHEIEVSPEGGVSTTPTIPGGEEAIVSLPRQDKVPGQPSVPKEAASAVQPAPPVSLTPSPPALQAPIAFTDIFFDFDSARIRPSERSFLQRNARLLTMEFPDASLLIEGHCDERGSVEYNLVLGKRRAQVIKNYLIDLGIPAHRLRIVSYGKERPFCRGHNERCWQLNRRGHFVLQKK